MSKQFEFKLGVMSSRCRNLLQAIDSKDREILRLQQLVRFLEIELEDEVNGGTSQNVSIGDGPDILLMPAEEQA